MAVRAGVCRSGARLGAWCRDALRAVLPARAGGALSRVPARGVRALPQRTPHAAGTRARRRAPDWTVVRDRRGADVALLAAGFVAQRPGLPAVRPRAGRSGERGIQPVPDHGRAGGGVSDRPSVRGAAVPRSAGGAARAVRREAGRICVRAAVRAVPCQSGAVLLCVCAWPAARLCVFPVRTAEGTGCAAHAVQPVWFGRPVAATGQPGTAGTVRPELAGADNRRRHSAGARLETAGMGARPLRALDARGVWERRHDAGNRRVLCPARAEFCLGIGGKPCV